MIIKFKLKDKTKFLNLFLKFYFFFTSILAIILITIFLNSGLWNNIKIPLTDRFYSSSINHYLNIFDITLTSSRFSKLGSEVK